MLRALIWKDMRVNRLPLVLAAALVVLSYLALAILTSLDPFTSDLSWPKRIGAIIYAGSVASHATAQLSLAVLAGNLFAIERVDRSAEFLAYLPASRLKVLQAKAILLVSLGVCLLFFPLAGTQLTLRFWTLPPDAERVRTLGMIFVISAMGFCAMGIGWWGSCCLSSNAVAILMAWIAPLLVSVSVQAMAPLFDERRGIHVLAAAWLSVGVCGFLFGTRHYLSRIEP